MEKEASSLRSAVAFPADRGDAGRSVQGTGHDLLDEWMLVAEGFNATHEAIVSEVADLFDLGEGPADVLLRLLMADQHRMPMPRLAHDAGMSSGGFTKLADRLCTAGLAGRVACEADRRVTYLELTDKGEETAESIARVATQSLRERVLSAIGPEGFGVLTDTMRRLRDANDDQGKARRTTSRRTPEAPPAR
ncbi:winged helix-turn-helix transcriptional regulator [Micromonospora sp. ALFpr18c]|uniref:MarR family winged helix-turn-helix transcriptional regulator n=1 Tax=unclassified Micromonospora TaxID=2617518 RepID=UPI00124B3BF9|nr:MarR family winged helix-turn-helix transcriptional regulator [Micromonospora sp. ALFpr18c]KAB1943854.1 winged helix-turn-helix transcriptional regulator [Micromonospora sp. ALFpr18c]